MSFYQRYITLSSSVTDPIKIFADVIEKETYKSTSYWLSAVSRYVFLHAPGLRSGKVILLVISLIHRVKYNSVFAEIVIEV